MGTASGALHRRGGGRRQQSRTDAPVRRCDGGDLAGNGPHRLGWVRHQDAQGVADIEPRDQHVDLGVIVPLQNNHLNDILAPCAGKKRVGKGRRYGEKTER